MGRTSSADQACRVGRRRSASRPGLSRPAAASPSAAASARWSGMANELGDRRALRTDVFTGIGKAARALGLGPRTVRQAVERGELPAYVFGQRKRVKVADVRRWVESR